VIPIETSASFVRVYGGMADMPGQFHVPDLANPSPCMRLTCGGCGPSGPDGSRSSTAASTAPARLVSPRCGGCGRCGAWAPAVVAWCESVTTWPTAPFSPSSRSSEDVHPPQAPHPPQRPFSRGEPAVDAARLRRASLRAGYPASPASLTAGQEKEADALPSASASVPFLARLLAVYTATSRAARPLARKNLRVVCRWLGRACHLRAIADQARRRCYALPPHPRTSIVSTDTATRSVRITRRGP